MESVSVSAEVLAYCAGVIDSDGCIRVKHHHGAYGSYIACRQVALGAVTLLRETFGGGLYRTHPAEGSNLRVQNGWAVTHKGAARCASSLLPYLRIKRRQAEIVLEVTELSRWRTRLMADRIAEQERLSAVEESWLTLREVSELTGRPVGQLHQAIRGGRLKSRKVGNRRMIARSCVALLSLPPGQCRPPEVTKRMADLWSEVRDLNRVGVRPTKEELASADPTAV